MTTPQYGDFIGFDHFRVTGTPYDYIAVDEDADRGVQKFVAHFRGEGHRHADLITKEMMIGALAGVDPPSSLAEAIAGFKPGNIAQKFYFDGVHKRLADNNNALQGVIALRNLDLPSVYITGPVQAVTAASDLTQKQAIALVAKFNTLINTFPNSPETSAPPSSKRPNPPTERKRTIHGISPLRSIQKLSGSDPTRRPGGPTSPPQNRRGM